MEWRAPSETTLPIHCAATSVGTTPTGTTWWQRLLHGADWLARAAILKPPHYFILDVATILLSKCSTCGAVTKADCPSVRQLPRICPRDVFCRTMPCGWPRHSPRSQRPGLCVGDTRRVVCLRLSSCRWNVGLLRVCGFVCGGASQQNAVQANQAKEHCRIGQSVAWLHNTVGGHGKGHRCVSTSPHP